MAQLVALTKDAIFRLRAQSFGFEYIGLSVDGKDDATSFKAVTRLILPCLTEDYEDSNEVAINEQRPAAFPASVEKRCQYGEEIGGGGGREEERWRIPI